ncbi:hypothetical protein BaRGS_00024826 [Batillaria attramentaria]|uniref:Uncharacterized protein n=1 Tax=Batillaria attramentaria TaxID=370345 RepID=A0ABD0KA47_9CAEN
MELCRPSYPDVIVGVELYVLAMELCRPSYPDVIVGVELYVLGMELCRPSYPDVIVGVELYVLAMELCRPSYPDVIVGVDVLLLVNASLQMAFLFARERKFPGLNSEHNRTSVYLVVKSRIHDIYLRLTLPCQKHQPKTKREVPAKLVE